jgi:hypothetical protein
VPVRVLALILTLAAGGLAAAQPAPTAAPDGPGPCSPPTAFEQRFLTLGLTCGPSAPGGPRELRLAMTVDLARAVADRWSGLTIDAASLKLATGSMAPDGEILRIDARQGFAGRLLTDFDARRFGSGPSPRLIAAGAEVFGLVGRQSLRGAVFYWCAPADVDRADGVPDRALCFSDTSETVRVPLAFLSIPIKEGLNVAESGRADSPYAPVSIQPAFNKGGQKPEVALLDRPHSTAFPVVVRLTRVEPGRIGLSAVILGGAGDVVLATTTEPRAADGSAEFDALGGRFRLSPAGAGFTATVLRPPAPGALITFASHARSR